MSSQHDDQGAGGCIPSAYAACGPYEPSIASSASSSLVSVFSDAPSVRSSIASSVSDDFRSSQEDARDRHSAQAESQSYYTSAGCKATNATSTAGAQPSYVDVTSVPLEQRQHPRRCSLARNQKPPPLVRQDERKYAFVDNLVDSATQMVEVIWPLSGLPCQSQGSKGRTVYPLRTYIEETLRRSRTSYSTLQVALYYLILIMPCLPKRDFTMEQSMDCPASRALMCGRRMFLAALILASKYLQDRNYSAKAWSKMSGLKVCEINANERTFLSKINWKLHVAKPVFDRWTEIVLRYTPIMQPPSPPFPALALSKPSWKAIIPLLTPELDAIPLPDSTAKPAAQPAAQPPVPMYAYSEQTIGTPTKSALSAMQIDSTSHESTPTPATVLPRFLEPQPNIRPPTPALARMGPLPTPQMTPSSVASSTPAVSACSSRRSSMSSAMAFAQRCGFERCASDGYPLPMIAKHRSRRPSVTSSASSRSSPEAILTDSRSSRASSISSVTTVSTTSSMAPQWSNLARVATCRNARLPCHPASVKEEYEDSATQPIILDDEQPIYLSPDFAINDKKAHTPHKHSKHAPLLASIPSHEKTRKRARTRGHKSNDFYEEIRYELNEYNAMEVDSDSDVASPSPAASQASKMLRAGYEHMDCMKEPQPPAALLRRESGRVPVQKNEGKKRTCLSASAMSISPRPMYGEVA